MKKENFLMLILRAVFAPRAERLPKGHVRTAYGAVVIPDPGNDVMAFMSQPRMEELVAQMRPALETLGVINLDEKTGFFYARTVHGHGAPLGQIDMECERDIFGFALDLYAAEVLSELHKRYPSEPKAGGSPADERRDDSTLEPARHQDHMDPSSPSNPTNPGSPFNPGNW